MKPNTILPTTRHRLVMTLGCAIAFLATILFLTQASTLPSSAASDPFVSPIRPGATPTTPGSPKMFDFAKDLDGNGFPDDFEQAVDHYLAARRRNPQNEAENEAERKAIHARIPYSAKSKALYARSEQLAKKLEKAKSESEYNEIVAEGFQMQKKLSEDAVYIIVNRYFEMKLRAEFEEKTARDLARVTEEAALKPVSPLPTPVPTATVPSSKGVRSGVLEQDSNQPEFAQNRVFLPLVSSTANQNTGVNLSNEADSVQGAAATAVYHAYLPLISSPHIVDFTKLQRGDLLFRMGKTGDFTLTNYAMIFSHNAFYDGNLKTYESNIDIGGVRRLELSTWQLPVFTALARATGKNKNGVSLTPTVVQGALNWAENKWGFTSTPYNVWITDKNTDARLYCSQLAWKTFSYIQAEVDSESQLVEDFLVNKFGSWIKPVVDLGILPDELYLDDNMSTYEVGIGSRE